jgi:hypothetical protein
MSEHGDETSTMPKRSEDTSLRYPITEDLPCPSRSGPSPLHFSSGSASRQHSASARSSETRSSNPATSGYQIFSCCTSLLNCLTYLFSDPSSPHQHPGTRKRLQEYDRAIRKSPNDVILRIHRAGTLVELGRLHDAFVEFNEALMLDPEHPELNYTMCLFSIRYISGKKNIGISCTIRSLCFWTKCK